MSEDGWVAKAAIRGRFALVGVVRIGGRKQRVAGIESQGSYSLVRAGRGNMAFAVNIHGGPDGTMNSLVLVPALAILLSQDPSDARAFFGGTVLSEFQADWYAKALARMDEPPLVPAMASARIFRFTLLPTWGHPISVRLTLAGTSGILEAKRLSGLGGYEPGQFEEKGSVRLGAARVEEFVALFGKLGFRQMAFEDPVRGFDGSEWILEAAESGEYHIVTRWTPTAYDTEKRGLRTFVDVCEWLFRASPLKDDVRNKGTIEISKLPK